MIAEVGSRKMIYQRKAKNFLLNNAANVIKFIDLIFVKLEDY